MTANSEANRDDDGRSPNRTVNGLGILTVIIVMYVLSPIPLLFLFVGLET